MLLVGCEVAAVTIYHEVRDLVRIGHALVEEQHVGVERPLHLKRGPLDFVVVVILHLRLKVGAVFAKDRGRTRFSQ